MSGVGKGERKGQTHRASTRRPVCGGLIYATDNKRSSRGKVKSIRVQAWMLQKVEASRIFRQSVYEGSNVVGTSHWQPLPSRKIPLLKDKSTPGPQCD